MEIFAKKNFNPTALFIGLYPAWLVDAMHSENENLFMIIVNRFSFSERWVAWKQACFVICRNKDVNYNESAITMNQLLLMTQQSVTSANHK